MDTRNRKKNLLVFYIRLKVPKRVLYSMFRCYFSSLYTTRFLSPFSLENAQPIRSRLSLEIITIPSYGPGRFLLLVAKKKFFYATLTLPVLYHEKNKKNKKKHRELRGKIKICHRNQRRKLKSSRREPIVANKKQKIL